MIVVFESKHVVKNNRVWGEHSPDTIPATPWQVPTPSPRTGTEMQLSPESVEAGSLAGGAPVHSSRLAVFEVLWPSEIPWHSFQPC